MTLIEQAQGALRELESQWISLLTWLADSMSVSAADLVAEWDPDEYYRANERLEDSRRHSPPAASKWTCLNFIDFGRYAELAGYHRDSLDALGTPPRNWRGLLGKQAKDGLVHYRNHLQHGGRFEWLPVPDQKKALDLLEGQHRLLRLWWPACPQLKVEPSTDDELRVALRLVTADPDDSAALMSQLQMRHISSARNLIRSIGAPDDLTRRFQTELSGLFRVGEKEMGNASGAIYLACLVEWKPRSSERERLRRRLAQALRDREEDRARIIVMVDGRETPRDDGIREDIELVLPTVREGAGAATVRAAVSRDHPTRYHLDLLRSLSASGANSVRELSRRWVAAFSVETVTNRFYNEFRELRDRLIREAKTCNPGIVELQGDPERDLDLIAFGTRQLSRILFLWFLQQKKWLGDSPGSGNPNFLTDAFSEHGGRGDTFFSDVLVPMFFDGLGRRGGEARKKIVDKYGWMPPLGGGIFTAGANDFEQRVFDFDEDGTPRRRIALPDDLFDPQKDEGVVAGPRARPRTRSVIGLLRGYRFTTQESTPDDQSVDPDPELLGKVFENLYQADERHATGAYYTPREIVQYICRRTLDGFLQEKTGRTQMDLDWLREEARDPSVSNRKLKPDESSELIDALFNLRVLDPAVGSGAFLLSMMHEIVTLRRGIEEADDRPVSADSGDVAEWKGRVATNCLYGVDINPMAVEICQLRLWLSMIVDLDAHAPRDVPTLPNLDFKVVAGDSLVDRMGEVRFFESLPPPETEQLNLSMYGQVQDLQTNLEGLKLRFAKVGGDDSNRKRQRDLRDQIRLTQVSIAQLQISHALDAATERLDAWSHRGPLDKAPTKKTREATGAHANNLRAMYVGLNPHAPFQKPFLWPVNFHEIFEERGGFDIVVANPPYVRAEHLDATDQEAYSHAFPEVHTGSADLLVYFYARAVQVLHEGGQLGFITSNKYMRAAYGAKIREFLPSNLRITQVIDFGDLPVFDVAAYPAVLIGRKTATPDPEAHVQIADLTHVIRRRLVDDGVAVNTDGVRLALQDLDGLLAASAVDDYPQALLRRDGWILEEPALVRLFDRLMSQGTPLGELVQGRMYRGVLTGLNEAFVIDEAKRAELIAADPRSAELIKPWLRGRDIRRWKIEWAGLYLITIRNSGDAGANNAWGNAKTEKEARRTFRQTYPAVEDHLSHYEDSYIDRRGRRKPGLRPRADQGKWWWELRACAYYAEFDSHKVVWPRNIPPWECRFAHDAKGSYINDKAYMMPGLAENMCRYLNSPLALWLVDKLTTKLQGGWLELKADTVVARIPVPMPLPALEVLEGIQLHQSISKSLGLSAEEATQVWDWCQERQVYRGAMTQTDDVDDDDDG